MPYKDLLFAAIASATGFALIGSASAQDRTQAPKPQQRSFEALDKNQDGKIGSDEAKADAALTKLFNGLDANKDGGLSREEFAAYDPAGATKNL